MGRRCKCDSTLSQPPHLQANVFSPLAAAISSERLRTFVLRRLSLWSTLLIRPHRLSSHLTSHHRAFPWLSKELWSYISGSCSEEQEVTTARCRGQGPRLPLVDCAPVPLWRGL